MRRESSARKMIATISAGRIRGSVTLKNTLMG